MIFLKIGCNIIEIWEMNHRRNILNCLIKIIFLKARVNRNIPKLLKTFIEHFKNVRIFLKFIYVLLMSSAIWVYLKIDKMFSLDTWNKSTSKQYNDFITIFCFIKINGTYCTVILICMLLGDTYYIHIPRAHMASPRLFSHLLIFLSINAIILREVIYSETAGTR